MSRTQLVVLGYAVIDVPDAPLVEGLEGVQLLEFATHQPRMTSQGPSAHPASPLAEARRIYGRVNSVWAFEPDASCLGLLGIPAPAVMGGRDVLAAGRPAAAGADS